MGIETALIVGALASTAAGAYTSHKAQRQAKDAAKDEKKAREAAQRALSQEKATAEANRLRDQSRIRQRALAGGSGYGGDILTSPLGAAGAPSLASKSLIGQ